MGFPDANVFVILYGETSDSGKRLLDGPGNNFERGQTDTFSVETVELGKITKVISTLSIELTWSRSVWVMMEPVLELVGSWRSLWSRTREPAKSTTSHAIDGLTRALMMERLKEISSSMEKLDLELLPTELPLLPVLSEVLEQVRNSNFQISYRADATVRISVVGDKGKIDNEKLENAKDNFERGKVDNFKISTLDLGEIKHVTIGHDGRGIGSGWFLDKVFVTHENTGKRWVFPCNRWLDKGEDDGTVLIVELVLTGI